MKELRTTALRLAPGILLLALIAWSGIFIQGWIKTYGTTHHMVLPNIEYVFWDILIGIAIANTIGVHPIFKPGINTYEFWLKLGIVFLGSRFLLVDVAQLGGTSLVVAGIAIGISIYIMTKLGKWFGLSQKLTSLLAIGSGICGVSAIIALKGAINADDEESGTAITAILAIGAFSLAVFPLIGNLLYLSDKAYGMWAGLAVDNTAEAIAAGMLYSDAAGKYAALAKTARNATIGFIVLGYAIHYARLKLAKEIENKAAFLWENFPKFVLGFLAMSTLGSLGVFSKAQLAVLATIALCSLSLTFAGVGLKIHFRAMRKQGLKPFIVGALGELMIAFITLYLVMVADSYFGLLKGIPKL